MTETERRKASALAAIQTSYGTDDGEYAATLFVSYHLDELDPSYWRKHLSKATPEPHEVLGLLVLRPTLGDTEEVMDFTLPDDVTDYVLCVRFNEEGEVDEIEIES